MVRDTDSGAQDREANSHCILTTGTNQLRSGLDVIVEGTAARMNDAAVLHRLAALWKSKLDWDFQVTNGGFRDPAGRDGPTLRRDDLIERVGALSSAKLSEIDDALRAAGRRTEWTPAAAARLNEIKDSLRQRTQVDGEGSAALG